MQDLPRHLGQHSGGMVICQGQLDSVVPLEPATMPGRVVVQWDKEDCADMGIVKVDLLGLGMMAVLEDSITLIRDHYKEEVDLAQAAGRRSGCLRHPAEGRHGGHVPDREPRADVVPAAAASHALLRHCGTGRDHPPGPDRRPDGQSLICMRRQGRQPVVYPHPSLEPVLERTLGVPLFQEQLLRMAMIAAGFTGGEAEELRRAFGFKRSEKRMRDIEVKLRAGMERNGISAGSAGADHSLHHFVRALWIS